MPTEEEIALFTSVTETGICHGNILVWAMYDEGTGLEIPVPKRKATCPGCFRDYKLTREVVDLDAYQGG